MEPRETRDLKKYWIAILAGGIVLSLVVWAVYLRWGKSYGWADWTGFGSYVDASGIRQRGKTLWDWMELLFVPTVLAFGAWFLNKSQREKDRTIAKQRNITEKVIAMNRQRQSVFDSFLDEVTTLIFDAKLCKTTCDNDEARVIARARTLSALNQLDRNRKGQVLQFLSEANLIKKGSRFIDLNNANLKGIQRAWANLERADLSGADLCESDFKWAHLEGANFIKALLIKADMQEAHLQGANFEGANLADANLAGANLEGATLEKAHLEGAKLIAAKVSNCKIKGALYNQFTQWPTGFDPSTRFAVNVDVEKEKAEFFPPAVF